LIASLPIFIIIIAGYLFALFNFFDKEASVVLIRLIFYIIMPITLFLDIAQLPISNTLRWDYMGAYFFTSIVVMLISIIMSRYLFARDRSNLIINAMASTHTNTAYLALPLFLLLFKTVSPVASIIIVQAVFNFFILLGMDVTTGAKQNKSYSYTIFAVSSTNIPDNCSINAIIILIITLSML
jgi:malonate transporter and related proteins